jgi:formamidopyrimidine-DNA glycosylase
MPELPEVENIVRDLAPLVGRRLNGAEAARSRPLRCDPETLVAELPGKRLLALARKGKHVIFEWEGGSKLVVHLGMSGQLLLRGEFTRLVEKHVHLVLHFGHESLVYQDPRKFGFVDFLTPDISVESYLGRLGWDALELAEPVFVSLMKRSRARIKPLLLNQKVVSGLGNIYVDESLFQAGIHPMRRAYRLSEVRLARLSEAVRAVLREAIRRGGSSFRTFLRPDGSPGAFQGFHRVYGRGGEPCYRCGASIRKITLGGRGTSFCPRCQK